MEDKPCILFTVFEPSGDEHAAPVIRELRKQLPQTPIYALGGEQMERAGAQLIERTTENATIGAASLWKVLEHHRMRRRLKRWLADHPVAVHVPTDSPAANWGLCRMLKRRGAKVVHMVAPQVWAWGAWRVRRLKKWSDLVLCILPFETSWFARWGVHARYIGHPMFDAEGPPPVQEDATSTGATRRLILLPGSRPAEIDANWPILLAVWERIRERFPTMEAVAVAAGESAERQLRSTSGPWPVGVQVVQDDLLSRVLDRADVVLAVSGTVTLHVARHGKPMVILYRVNPWGWHLVGRWALRTKTFALPNLIAAGGPGADRSKHIVKEFVPFTGGPGDIGPIVEELVSLMEDKEKSRRQIEALAQVVKQFDGHDAAKEAAEAIAEKYEV